MAACWQGYGTLGVGEQVGSVTWGNGNPLLAMALHDERGQMQEVSVARDIGGGKGGQFMASFAGQGQLPYQVRRRAREQQAEVQRQARVQAREGLLQALKKAVQRLLMLAVQRECPPTVEQGAWSSSLAAPAAAQRSDAEEQRALHQVVDALYSIYSHGIKSPGRKARDAPHQALVGRSCIDDTAEAVWRVLQRVAHAVPSRCLTLALVQQQLKVVTAEGAARAFVRLCICDKSIEDVLAGTAGLAELEEMYEDWAFLRDLEHNNALPTLLGGVAHVQVYFNWLHSDDAACGALPDPPPSVTPPPSRPSTHKGPAGIKGSTHNRGEGPGAGCGGAGVGRLSAIPENAEHLEEDEEWVEIQVGVGGGGKSGMGIGGRGKTGMGRGRSKEGDAALRMCELSTNARRPKGKVKKVREITISEAVSGNSGLGGEGDKERVHELDSSAMEINKLIESVSQAMLRMEGTAGRKGARGKAGKKKKSSDNHGSCPAMSTDGGSAPSRDSVGVSANGIGVGDGGGGGGDGKGGQGGGDYDAHFPCAPAPAAGTGSERGLIAERERACDDRHSSIAAAAELTVLPSVEIDGSRGQMGNHVCVGGQGQGKGEGCDLSSLLVLASPQSYFPPRTSKEIDGVDFNSIVPGEAPASPSLASLPPPPPTSRDATALPKVESEFVRNGFGLRTRGLHVEKEAVAAAVGKSSHSSNGGEQAEAVLQDTNQDDCLEDNIGICSSLTCTAAVRSPRGRGGMNVVGAVREREVQAAGTGKEWKEFLRNHCNGLLVDVSLSPLERFLAATVDVGEEALVTFDQVRPVLLRSGFSEEQCFDLMREVLEGNLEGEDDAGNVPAHEECGDECGGKLARRKRADEKFAAESGADWVRKRAAAGCDSLQGIALPVTLPGAEEGCVSGGASGSEGERPPILHKPGPPKPKCPPPPVPVPRGLDGGLEGGVCGGGVRSGLELQKMQSLNNGDNEGRGRREGLGRAVLQDGCRGCVDGEWEGKRRTEWDQEREILVREILEKEREEMEKDKALMEFERRNLLEELERQRERKGRAGVESVAAVSACIGQVQGDVGGGVGKSVSGGGWRWGKGVKEGAGLRKEGWLSRLTRGGGGGKEAMACGAVSVMADKGAQKGKRDGGEEGWGSEVLGLQDEGGVGGRTERLYTGAPVGLITTIEGLGSVQWGEGGMGAIVGQKSACPGCGDAVASGLLGTGRWCDYARAYYCGACHRGDTHVIIARVLKDWDFVPRPVSIPAVMFLRDNQTQPLLSISNDLSHGARAKAGKALVLVTSARRRAAHLRDYVVQCPNFPNSRCQEEDRIAAVTLATRSHLLGDDDTVSLQDLVEMQNGALLKFLDATAEPWALHVLHKCRLCHDKGHCCEICRSEERLFPWDEDRISKCKHCGAISHQRCAAAAARGGLSCRKCERIRRVREDRQRRLSDTSSGGYSSGLSSGGGSGGLWGEAGAVGLYSEVEWEQDEGDLESDLDMLLPLAPTSYPA